MCGSAEVWAQAALPSCPYRVTAHSCQQQEQGKRIACQALELCVCCWPAALDAQKCLLSLRGSGSGRSGNAAHVWGQIGGIGQQVLTGHVHTQGIDFWRGKLALVN